MANRMPEALREHFEKKQEKGGDDKEGKMQDRKEALRKAKKAKAKREAEKASKG